MTIVHFIAILAFATIGAFAARMINRKLDTKSEIDRVKQLLRIGYDPEKILNKEIWSEEAKAYTRLTMLFKNNLHELQSMETAQELVAEGKDPQTILDEEIWSEEAKQWASDYISARDFSHLLEHSLQQKAEAKPARAKI
ncbi:hypothetical protein BCEN4_740155 [Burkholderia cenocepacia]|uniref:hypothetical protein n=1 Tax=Burkholderia cenocepacia TaxID=95486 RepID=UPI00192BF2F3|nr:hypothetical protein [Burkholderia cenocepacia]CAD9228052.1 hypothetical protein BCEN4_740155 [Burkholderia cenocepacia]